MFTNFLQAHSAPYQIQSERALLNTVSVTSLCDSNWPNFSNVCPYVINICDKNYVF
jgi:hypothetical protein